MRYDIIIVGQGMAAAALVAALKPFNYRIALVDSKPLLTPQLSQKVIDGRKIALSYGSKIILEKLNLWSFIQSDTTAIHNISVSAATQFGVLNLTKEAFNYPALGYVIKADLFLQQLHRAMLNTSSVDYYDHVQFSHLANQEKVTLTFQQNNQERILEADWLIAADGSESWIAQQLNIPVSEKDYQHTAIVSAIKSSHMPSSTAYQRYTAHGTIALLPMQDQVGLIYSMKTQDAQLFLKKEHNEQLHFLQEQFGFRIGRLTEIGDCFSYPIKMRIPDRIAVNRCLLFGNAAHQLSPLAAQGFNLILQDLAVLIETIQMHSLNDDEWIKTYPSRLKTQQTNITGFTDTLTSITQSEHPLYGLLGLGLFGLNSIDTVKNHYIELLAGITPTVKRYLRDNQ